MSGLPPKDEQARWLDEISRYSDNAIIGAMIPVRHLQHARLLLEAQSDEVRRLREALLAAECDANRYRWLRVQSFLYLAMERLSLFEYENDDAQSIDACIDKILSIDAALGSQP